MHKQIQAELAAGAFPEAARRAQEVLRDNPHDGRARELLGQVLVRLGRAVEGREQLEHASMLVPLGPDAAVALAECYLSEQQRQLGLEMLVHVSTRRDTPAATFRAAARAADSANQSWIARAICERALRRFPDDPQTYYELGYYCARLGSLPLMEANVRKAIDLDPANVCFRVGLAAALLKQDRTADAYELVETFGPTELQDVCCRDCLEMLLSVFDACEDTTRSALCRTRLATAEPGDSTCH